jgi:hypothetical protein
VVPAREAAFGYAGFFLNFQLSVFSRPRSKFGTPRFALLETLHYILNQGRAKARPLRVLALHDKHKRLGV